MKLRPFLPLIAMLCASLLLFCSSDIELPPSPESKLSSPYSSSSMTVSSSSAGTSSSSAALSSSSVAMPSSSSVPSSSAGTSSSSSSLGSNFGQSSSSIKQSSSSSEINSSSSLCTASDNTDTYYCSNGTMKPYGSTPVLGGKTYKTVVIGTQTWMAENLNYYFGSGSKCGDGSALSDANTTTCDKYGRLYNWAAAMNIDAKFNNQQWGVSDVKHTGHCPIGFHIPSNADWITLSNFVSSDPFTSGTKLKAISGWNTSSGYKPGTDNYGFCALPGSFGIDNTFFGVGDDGIWWSASEGDNYSNIWYMGYNYEQVNSTSVSKSRWYSVRCVKD